MNGLVVSDAKRAEIRLALSARGLVEVDAIAEGYQFYVSPRTSAGETVAVALERYSLRTGLVPVCFAIVEPGDIVLAGRRP